MDWPRSEFPIPKRCKVGKKILFLVGPTGSGKTELALCLARRLGAEIVSADSMLVYRGMEIGTAKPAAAERRKIRHHLLDLVSPRSNFSVSQHRRLALRATREILKRGRLPLVVGGGGLYVAALWKGISPHPGGSSKIRERLQREAKKKGTAHLYERLQKIDPQRAEKIHPRDERRIVRALEIVEISGKTPSEWYRKKESLEDLGFLVRAYGITRDREDLYRRINRRVERMLGKGWIAEVKRLRKKGFSKTAREALGYREILEYLGKGEVPAQKPLLQRLIQQRTRQFAKRQLTWFRREKEIQWISWEPGESASKVCDKIITESRSWLNA